MSRRWYRRLLRILPLDFRADYGRDMEQVFRDQHEDAVARGRWSVARVWAANAGALLAIGPREHAAQFAQDVRYALRGMRAHPGFVIVALVMIALGTGANAAMFSIIDAVMLRSPFEDGARLAIVLVGRPGQSPGAAISLDQYRSLLASAPALAAIGAMGGGQRPILGGLGELRRMNVECVDAGMFRTLGVSALAGRTFTADEDRAGGPGAVVLSYDFWQRDLGAAPDAVGRIVTLNGVPATIVGIMPRRFGGPHSRNNNDGWLPLGPALGGTSAAGCAARTDVNLIARVKSGLGFDAAAAQAAATAGIDRIPGWQGALGETVTLISLEHQTILELRTPLLTLLGAVGLVLLIACANVANFQLERVFGRRRELAVRIAIGATRSRIVRQTLTENLLLYVFGCAAGLLAAQASLHLIVGLLPSNVPHLREIEISARILATTVAVSCAAGLLVGLVPAIQASAPSVIDDLRGSAGGTPRAGWIRHTLVIGQIALSLTLLVGAALLVRTFLSLRPSAPGFNAVDKLTASVRFQGRPGGDRLPFFKRLFDGLRAVPGVQAVAGSTYLPMSGLTSSALVVAGETSIDTWTAAYVTPNYFAEMDIPIMRGRTFTERDDESAPQVAIVNEALVRRGWPRGDALGALIEVESGGRRVKREIVGVMHDTRTTASDLTPRPELYVPFPQGTATSVNVIIRATNPRDPRLASSIRDAAAAVDATQVLDRMTPLEDMLEGRVARPRFGAWLLGLFAGMALLLSAVGLTTSIAWWVTRRTREIGVRMALGANPGQVTRMVVRQGLTLGLSGIVLGLAGAAASTRLLVSWLYGVTPLDPRTFAWSAAGMVVIAAFASYLPARRAARIDPLIALRSE